MDLLVGTIPNFDPSMLPHSEEISDWVTNMGEWMMEMFSWIRYPILLCIFFALVFASLQCLTPKYASKLGSFFEYLIVRVIETLFSTFPIFGGKSRQTLLFIPNADQQSLARWSDYIYKSNQCNGFYEISQDALSRYLLSNETADLIDKLNSNGSSKTFDNKIYEMLCYLKDFNKEAKTDNFEIYRSSMHWLFDPLGIHHTFIVFKTSCQTEGEYWWSLEKNMENIVLQRSRNKFAVVNRLKRWDRKNVKPIKENNPVEGPRTAIDENNPVEGPRTANREQETMTKLLTTLWAHNIITEKYHVVKASCQTFVQFIEKANSQYFADFVNKQITTSTPALPYSSATSNKKIEPIINMLTTFPKWPPLFAIVYLGDPVLLENLLCNSKDPNHTNVNVVAYDTSLLQLAILFSRTEMVDILLRNPKLDTAPRKDEGSDKPWKGMSVFHTAAGFTGDAKIIDLLFKSDKVNIGNDTMGRSALHIAAMESNEITVGHLLKMNQIEPNARDTDGLTPFHLAAQHTDNIRIIDLLLEAKQKQENGIGIDDRDSDGRTALHHAVIGSNVTIARHLIEKGANPNQTDKTVDSTTPLELAAQHAKDMKIVNLFLENETVYKELYENSGDRVFNFATKNDNAGLKYEIEYGLRNKGIKRKQEIPPQEDDRLDTQKKIKSTQPTGGTEEEGENIWV